jgi:molecular chaperone GrpE
MENTASSGQETEKLEDLAPEAQSSQSQESSEPSKKDDPQDPAKKLQDELAEAKDKYLRLYAEFENHRRRTAKEKLEMIQSANEQLLKALIPVADDFERGENSFKEKTDKEAEGFFLIQNKFKKILDQYGVKAMPAEKGSTFDADFHEAITQIPAPDEKLKGKVVDVIEKGYLLNDKVIRFAKVVVGS